jgi:hypothetical protein
VVTPGDILQVVQGDALGKAAERNSDDPVVVPGTVSCTPSFFAFLDHHKTIQSHRPNGFGVFVLFLSVLGFLVNSTIILRQNAKTTADQWLG